MSFDFIFTSEIVVRPKPDQPDHLLRLCQGRRKPFISGQGKVGSEHYSVECVDDVVSLIGLNITQPFCLLLSFLHDRISCKHNAWAPDNLEPLDMFFLPIIA